MSTSLLKYIMHAKERAPARSFFSFSRRMLQRLPVVLSIGEDQTNTGEATKADGDWTNMMNALDMALEGTGWQYALGFVREKGVICINGAGHA